jgi:hypothetical protein
MEALMHGIDLNYAYPSLCYLVGGGLLLAVIIRTAAKTNSERADTSVQREIDDIEEDSR